MRKIFYFIIGFGTMLLAPQALADYCSLPGQYHGLYRDSYCNVTSDDDNEIYKTMASQLGVSDPGLVKKAIFGEVSTAALRNENPAAGTLSYAALQGLYDREKIIYQTKKTLKQRFAANEKWANATLRDSPFDLISDLNLVDITLFGSGAQWTSDVYQFPTEDGSRPNPPAQGGSNTPGPGPGSSGLPGVVTGGGLGAGGGDSGGPDIIECVPPNDPGAETPTTCGNGTIETGETCDDGNRVSGDGCSAGCFEENGPSLTCRDPDALSLKDYDPSAAPAPRPGGTPGNSDVPITCEPGKVPRKRPAVSTPPATAPVFPQPQNYPGPYSGGTFKDYPPSGKPDCPPGTSSLSLQYATPGGTTSGTDLTDLGLPECIPTQLCNSLDDARGFFYGFLKGSGDPADWKQLPEDSKKRQALESIEVLFCVNLKKINRPLTPYQANEGCIDCHLAGIVDSLEKVLNKNVAPLQNTMNAFSMSNRFGPTFAFNLNPSVKGLTTLQPEMIMPVPDETDAVIKKALQDAAHARDPYGNERAGNQADRSADPAATAEALQAEQVARDAALTSKLKDYAWTGDTGGDLQMARRVSQQLNLLIGGFSRVQSVYESLVSTEFNKIPQCKL